MTPSPDKALRLTFTIGSLAILSAALLLPLGIGVWLPDVFTGRLHTLAAYDATNGYRFRVIQYWNNVDFYSTELHIISPDGKTEVRTLDGDDSKSWSVPVVVDETNRVVSVTLGGRR
jgi:hypothetical protein